MNLPLVANLLLSYRCNLRCPFCFENTLRSSERKQELTTEQWCDLVDVLSEMKVLNLMLTGGEIFLHPGIWDILEHAVRGRMRYKLISNGTLIDENVVAKLKKLGQCGGIQISIDGLENDHDAIRGKGMFRKSVRAIHLLSDAGFSVSVNTVVTRSNYRKMPALAEFLSSLPIRSFRLNALSEDASCKNSADSDSMTEADLAEFISFFYGKWEQFPKMSRYLGVFVPLAYLQNYYPLRDPKGCIACRNPYYMISFHPDGAITPCIDRKNPILGYFPQDSVQQIWTSAQFADFRRAVKGGKKLFKPECDECRYAFYCRRFCPTIPIPKFCLTELKKHLIARGITDF